MGWVILLSFFPSHAATAGQQKLTGGNLLYFISNIDGNI
jgi:hypothetical protein